MNLQHFIFGLLNCLIILSFPSPIYNELIFELVDMTRLKSELSELSISKNYLIYVIMENLQITNTTNVVEIISSREIAELTGKRHADVMRDIRKQESVYFEVFGSQSADNQNERKFASVKYTDTKGELRNEFQLTKSQCLFIVSGYRTVLRAKIQKRWEDLESGRELPLNVAAMLSNIQNTLTDISTNYNNKIASLESNNRQLKQEIEQLKNKALVPSERAIHNELYNLVAQVYKDQHYNSEHVVVHPITGKINRLDICRKIDKAINVFELKKPSIMLTSNMLNSELLNECKVCTGGQMPTKFKGMFYNVLANGYKNINFHFIAGSMFGGIQQTVDDLLDIMRTELLELGYYYVKVNVSVHLLSVIVMDLFGKYNRIHNRYDDDMFADSFPILYNTVVRMNQSPFITNY